VQVETKGAPGLKNAFKVPSNRKIALLQWQIPLGKPRNHLSKTLDNFFVNNINKI